MVAFFFAIIDNMNEIDLQILNISVQNLVTITYPLLEDLQLKAVKIREGSASSTLVQLLGPCRLLPLLKNIRFLHSPTYSASTS